LTGVGITSTAVSVVRITVLAFLTLIVERIRAF
jgi:hypothetical protein